MHLNASKLVLGGDNHDADLFNKSGSQNNDLYIGNNAQFNLYVDDYAMFNSGIDGESTGAGVLNLKPLMKSDRYNTGSHIDSHGWSMLAELAKEDKRPDGRLTWGGFIEGGRGNYSSFNSFSSGDTHGGGKTDYAGIGGFIRHDGAESKN